MKIVPQTDTKRVNNHLYSNVSYYLDFLFVCGGLRNTFPSHHEDQATEESQENDKLLQIQLQLPAALPDPRGWDVLSGRVEKPDSD